jgi:galactokinase/mevalonate kinase-like predicted kinase
MNDEKLVITKTLIRVSFIVGVPDMPHFYKKYGGGRISAAINKSIIVAKKNKKNEYIYKC